jgi:hypothetical protein
VQCNILHSKNLNPFGNWHGETGQGQRMKNTAKIRRLMLRPRAWIKRAEAGLESTLAHEYNRRIKKSHIQQRRSLLQPRRLKASCRTLRQAIQPVGDDCKPQSCLLLLTRRH